MARRLILDSGAIIALAAGEEEPLGYLRVALRSRAAVIVPAVVITETTRGGPRDAPVDRIIRQILRDVGEIAPIDEAVARSAGRLLRVLADAYAGHAPPTIDALVVAVAVERGGGVLLTGDPADLTALAADHPQVHIRDYRTR